MTHADLDNDEGLENLQNDDGEDDEQFEQEARQMGWQPADEFKGNKDRWVSAKEFVEKGRHVMPILVENNKRLQKELEARDARIEKILADSNKAIEKLEKHYTDANLRNLENQRKQLLEDIKTARQENDVDAEFALREQLDDVKEAQKTAAVPEKRDKEQGNEQELNPAYVEWVRLRPWFGKDTEKTNQYIAIAKKLRDGNSPLQGIEFYNEVEVQYIRQQAKTGGNVDRVEGSKGGRGSGGNGKTYADLPKEAKEACDSDAEELVGADRRYKTIGDWRNQYAKIYFGED